MEVTFYTSQVWNVEKRESASKIYIKIHTKRIKSVEYVRYSDNRNKSIKIKKFKYLYD